MKVEKDILHLPEGDKYAEVTKFSNDDCKQLKIIYDSWRDLCANLNKLNARAVNLPEGLSEIAFAVAYNMWRTPSNIVGANSSFDCYDPNERRGYNRIQVKACSVLPDLTSFGPNSQWDRIFFVDFYRQGKWDGTFDVYEIDTNDIENYHVNAMQTVADQKRQGRRPRFSIYSGLISFG
ncbi:MAG: Bsp6I family type II restriction endonuclease, partial [Malacoplasma sp.]|nr:Bsp6I family type II restriction endonuclease [Malacoplasma sp.]